MRVVLFAGDPTHICIPDFLLLCIHCAVRTSRLANGMRVCVVGGLIKGEYHRLYCLTHIGYTSKGRMGCR